MCLLTIWPKSVASLLLPLRQDQHLCDTFPHPCTCSRACHGEAVFSGVITIHILQGKHFCLSIRARERQGSKYGEPARDGKRDTIFLEIVSSAIGITALIKIGASERYDIRQGIRSRHAGAREILYAS